MAPPEAQLQQPSEEQARLVLITNVSRQEPAAHDVFLEYERQPSVERRFPFLKHPLVVEGTYLKPLDRAYA